MYRPREAPLHTGLKRVIRGVRRGFDQRHVSHPLNEAALVHRAGRRRGLIQVAAPYQAGPFGPYVAHTRDCIAPELSFHRQVPVLEIGVFEIGREAVHCRRGLESRAAGERV